MERLGDIASTVETIASVAEAAVTPATVTTPTVISSRVAIPDSLPAPPVADANGGLSIETAPINVGSVPSPSSASVTVPDNGRDYIGGGGGLVGGSGHGGGGGIIKTGIADAGEGPPKTVTLVGFDDIRTTPNSTPYKACESKAYPKGARARVGIN